MWKSAMGKKAGTAKAKKGSKTQSGKPVKPAAGQEKTGSEAVAAPRAQRSPGSFLRLAKGGERPGPEGDNKVQALPARTKETAPKTVRREAGGSLKQFFGETSKFFQGAWAELKKVHWPTRQELVVYTIVVISSVIFVGLLIWIVDSILSKLLGFIL
jgi:preprotein translocase subunit SecE